jgi:hypothetical protein
LGHEIAAILECDGAEVAELADAPVSKSGGVTPVRVRVPPSAIGVMKAQRWTREPPKRVVAILDASETERVLGDIRDQVGIPRDTSRYNKGYNS